jgi:UDP-2,3-diacylglucosamine pyrophosphatase LpxH
MSKNKAKYRSVWISDVHLGTKGCQAVYLEDFLRSFDCDNLFLVGDIIDGWAITRGSRFFPQDHVNIVRRFLNKARNGTIVKYVIGNHDEFLRKYVDQMKHVGNIEIADEFVHETADGRKLWVIHGDLYDGVVRYHKWLSHFGDIMYGFLLYINKHYNKIRKFLGHDYWSLSSHLKLKVKSAVEFINSFESAIATECKKMQYDGVVCGHIHHAEIKDIDGITYYNDGDWVESCTALVEHEDGKMELITWHKITHK